VAIDCAVKNRSVDERSVLSSSSAHFRSAACFPSPWDHLGGLSQLPDELDGPRRFHPIRVLHDLNARKDPAASLRQLEAAYDNGHGQACLILRRIYEFGSYNEIQVHSKALAYYDRVNDTSVVSALSFFHRQSSLLRSSRRTRAWTSSSQLYLRHFNTSTASCGRCHVLLRRGFSSPLRKL
jgi:hypothetical protein